MTISLNTQDILRAQDIKRWTIVRTAKDQSLAEHTFNVCMIARAICAKMKISDASVIKMALEHDLDEIKTGDIPSPAKRDLKPKENFKWYGDDNQMDRRLKMIVKAADKMESWLFIKENGLGRHAVTVTSNCYNSYHDFLFQIKKENKELANAIRDVELEITTGEFYNE